VAGAAVIVSVSAVKVDSSDVVAPEIVAGVKFTALTGASGVRNTG